MAGGGCESLQLIVLQILSWMKLRCLDRQLWHFNSLQIRHLALFLKIGVPVRIGVTFGAMRLWRLGRVGVGICFGVRVEAVVCAHEASVEIGRDISSIIFER